VTGRRVDERLGLHGGVHGPVQLLDRRALDHVGGGACPDRLGGGVMLSLGPMSDDPEARLGFAQSADRRHS
jgi:hypothetical protein